MGPSRHRSNFADVTTRQFFPTTARSDTDNSEVASITKKAEKRLKSPPQLWRPYLDDVTESSKRKPKCCSPPKLYNFASNVPQEYLFRPVSFPELNNYQVHYVPPQNDNRKTPEIPCGRITPVEHPSPNSGRSTPEMLHSPSYSASNCCSPSSSIASTDDVKMSPKVRPKTGASKRNHPYSSERLKRSKFTEDQLRCLNEAFMKKTYLTLQERHDIALKLNLSEEQVKNWFQNKRMKTKRDYIHAVDKGLIIPLENPGLPKFSRMPVNYFTSLPVSPVKFVMNGL